MKDSLLTELPVTLFSNILTLVVMLVVPAVPLVAQIIACKEVTRLKDSNDDQRLEKVIKSGGCISRRIAGKKIHSYSLELAGGQFIYTEVNQGGANGIDVVVALISPDGTEVKKDSHYGSWEIERIPFIAKAPGTYRINIYPFDDLANVGEYILKTSLPRKATPSDEEQVKAFRLYEEGEKLYWRSESDSLESALEKFEGARNIFQRLGDRPLLARTLIYLGKIRQALSSSSREASETYKQGLKLFQDIGEQFWAGVALQNLADAYFSSGNLNKALEEYDRAINVLGSISANDQKASALNDMGLVYAELGETDEAHKVYLQALSLVPEKEKGNSDKRLKGTILNNIGLVYLTNKEYQKAIDFLEQAALLRKDEFNHAGESQSLTNLGLALTEAKDFSRALRVFRQTLDLLGSESKDSTRPLLLYNISDIFEKRGNQKLQREYLEEALEVSRSNHFNQIEGFVLSELARLELANGRIDRALEYMERVTRINEARRNRFIGHESVAGYFDYLVSDYKLYIDVLMKLHQVRPKEGFDSKALLISEQYKARRLLDVLSSSLSNTAAEIPRSLEERRFKIQSEIRDLMKRRDLLTADRKSDDKFLSERIRRLVMEYRNIQGEIYEETFAGGIRSFVNSISGGTNVLPIEKIQKQILDKDTLLLEYSLGEDVSYLWLVSNDQVLSFSLPKKQVIEGLASNVFGMLSSDAMNRATGRPTHHSAEFHKYAKLLSNAILGPLGNQLGSKRLLVVADGALRYVPFAALPSPEQGNGRSASEYKPLIVDHEIINLPSVSVFQERRGKNDECNAGHRQLALIADPVLSTVDDRFTGNSAASRRFQRGLGGNSQAQRLLFTSQEAAGIASLADESNFTMRTGFDASRGAILKTELSSYQILHFATHTIVDETTPELSRIQLSRITSTGEPKEAYVYTFDVENLYLPSELVVLSSCQTAFGRHFDGEGLMGITRAFMAAGAKRLIASLWSVPGDATAELMQRFYQELLLEKKSPGAALRSAQISMWKDERWNAPYNWSAFIMQGEWTNLPEVPIQNRERGSVVLKEIEQKIGDISLRLTRDLILKNRFGGSDHQVNDDLATDLIQGNTPLGKFLLSKLSRETIAGSQRFASEIFVEWDEQLRRRLIKDMNRIVESEDLYTPGRFTGVTLSAETQALMASKPQGRDKINLNWLLLQDAYPRSFSWLILPPRTVHPKMPAESYSWGLEDYCLQSVSMNSRQSVLIELKNAETQPMYGCYRDQAFGFGDPAYYCHFIDSINFRDKTLYSVVEQIPNGWNNVMKGDKAVKVWTESTVRVDSAGYPISNSRVVRPLALQTKGGLYLTRQRGPIQRDNYAPSFGIKLTGKRFILKQGVQSNSRVVEIMQVFRSELASKFAAEPYRASLIEDKLLPSGELLVRTHIKSHRKQSRSEAEITSYLVSWRAADGEFLTAYEYLKKGVGAGSSIFINIESFPFLKARGSRYFNEGTAELKKRYQTAAEQTLSEVVTSTCTKLRGDMSATVCTVN